MKNILKQLQETGAIVEWGIKTTPHHGRVLYVDDEVVQFSIYNKDGEIIGRPFVRIDNVDWLDPSDTEAHRRHFETLIKEEEHVDD